MQFQFKANELTKVNVENKKKHIKKGNCNFFKEMLIILVGAT